MFDDRNYLAQSNPYKRVGTTINISRTIYYGEVISIDDPTDGGRIKVRIPELLDIQLSDTDLPWCYPVLPKFFHLYPKVGEMVRIFIEDMKYPQKGRFWEGSIISQPQKIEFDSFYTAQSTTNVAIRPPEAAPSTYPDAVGVYPLKTDVAIIGRVNTDVILRINEVHIRAGKHENNNVLKLNKKNPARIDLVFEPQSNKNEFYSSTVIMSDKIALISHDGNPKIKAAELEPSDREKIFNEGHPMARADVVVKAFEIIRDAIVGHLHPYSGLPADNDAIVTKLKEIDFNAIIQKNIVIN